MRLFPILALCATPLMAETNQAPSEDRPFPDWVYFNGIYDRAGRGAGAEPPLFNDRVRIERAADWESLSMTGCSDAGSDLDYPMTFYRDLQAEVPHALRAAYWHEELTCEFYNESGNTPLISCLGGDGTWMVLRMVTSDLDGTQAADCPARG